MAEIADRVVALGGAPGMGKTTLLRRIIEERPRVIIVEQTDAKNEYDALRYKTVGALAADLFTKRPKKFRVSVSTNREGVIALLELAHAYGDVTLVLEEAGRYFPPELPTPWQLTELVERGRHAGPSAKDYVSLVFVGQRFMRIPLVARACLNVAYAFRQPSEHDRKWVEAAPGATPEIAEELRDLAPFSYWRIPADGEPTKGQTSA